MELTALIILIISALIGFAAVFFTTFGTLIIFIGTVIYSFLTNFSIITINNLAVLFALYLCGEVLEYVFIIVGAKKWGASNASVVGALIGGIGGAVIGTVFLGVGLVLGTFLGVFLGAFLVEMFIHKDLIRSLKAGAGGIVGRIGSIVAKVIIAIVMIVIAASKVLPRF
jgi:uncharacterized protein YqgC (DUF456 family)